MSGSSQTLELVPAPPPPLHRLAGATVASPSSIVFFSGIAVASLSGTLLSWFADKSPLPEQPEEARIDSLSGPATSLGDVVRELQELRLTVCPPCPVCPTEFPTPRWYLWWPQLSLDFWAGLVLALIFYICCRAVRTCWLEYRWLRRAAVRERRAITGEAVRFK